MGRPYWEQGQRTASETHPTNHPGKGQWPGTLESWQTHFLRGRFYRAGGEPRRRALRSCCPGPRAAQRGKSKQAQAARPVGRMALEEGTPGPWAQQGLPLTRGRQCQGRHAIVGEGPVLEPQALLPNLHLDPALGDKGRETEMRGLPGCWGHTERRPHTAGLCLPGCRLPAG